MIEASISDRLFKGENLSVKMFGAVQDGSTDDGGSIQSAINYAASQNVPLLIPGGNPFLFGAPLIFPSGLIMHGRDGGTLMQKDDATENVTPLIIVAGSAVDISIANVVFDGNFENQTATAIGSGFGQGTNILELTGGSRIRLRGCSFRGSLLSHIYGHSIEDVDIVDCVFREWRGANQAAAVQIIAADGGEVLGVRVKGCLVDGRMASGTGGTGINFIGTSTNKLKHIQVHGNRVYCGNAGTFPEGDPPEGSDTLGIQVWSAETNGHQDVTVEGNTVIGELLDGKNRCYGISVAIPGTDTGPAVISGNSITECHSSAIELSSYTTCKGNTVQNSGPIAIGAYYRANTYRTIIADNIIIEPKPSLFYPETGANGIALQAGDADVGGPYELSSILVENNIIISTEDIFNGVRVQSQASSMILGVQIRHNHIIGNGATDTRGVTIGIDPDTTGVISHTTVEGNSFENLQIGIYPGGTNGRYLFNRFKDVASRYGASPSATDCVIDVEGPEGRALAPQGVWIRGLSSETIAENGSVYLPDAVGAATHFANNRPGSTDSPSPAFLNQVAFNDLQGSILSVNSYFTGSPNWAQASTAAYTRAMFLALGSSRFAIRFGAATNTSGAEPGDIAFQVVDGNNTGGELQKVATGVGFPFVVEAGSHLRSFSGSPEGIVSAPQASLGLRYDNGTFYFKATGSGNTGWVQVQIEAIYSGSGSPEGVVTATPGKLYLNTAGAVGEILWEKVSGSGNTGWASNGGTIWFPTNSPTNTEFRTNKKLGLGKVVGTGLDLDVNGPVQFDSTVKMNALTATRPTKLNGSKQFIAALIDVNSANDIGATGFSANDVPVWDSTKFIPVAGVSKSFTEITAGPFGDTFVKTVALSGVVPPGLTLTVTTDTALTGFTVATHTSVNGVVNS